MREYSAVFFALLLNYNTNQQLHQQEWKSILNAYQQPQRAYHNQKHIEYMLELWNMLKTNLEEPEIVFLAIIYHDLVYDPKAKDNEKQSALMATAFLEKINYPKSKIKKVASFIMATQTHQLTENNEDLKCFLDFDLAILGTSPKNYLAYSKQIRKEYGFYEASAYKHGRSQVLNSFLQKKEIYKTVYFKNNFEQNARKNLQNELETLKD